MRFMFPPLVVAFMALGLLGLSGLNAYAQPTEAQNAIDFRKRAENIAYRLFAGNQDMCRFQRLDPGFMTHTLSDYPRRLRKSLRELSVSEEPIIGFVRPGSAPSQITVGDSVTTEDDISLSAWDRRITYQLLRGSLNINGQKVVVQGEPICALHLERDKRRGLHAKTNGRSISLSDKVLRLQSDDALAFVIAHEMSHLLLGHTRADVKRVMGMEVAADRTALYLMANAGFDPHQALTILGEMQSPINDLAAIFSSEKSSSSRRRRIGEYLAEHAALLEGETFLVPPGLDPEISRLPAEN